MKHRWQGRPGLLGSVCARCGLTLEWLDGMVRRLTAATGEVVPTPGRKMPPCPGRRPTKPARVDVLATLEQRGDGWGRRPVSGSEAQP